ncbi:guanine nucleotide-binding protein G(I)/G(S)/G(O) subunit gamma-8 isoform X1 [Camelus ferus]|uniref:Guanine nucleotide-binding protein subunit gamma n=2 Tax=Camelus TaxID=9836 RepID=A0A8B7K3Q2_CAMFR|nr:guanine nucleotide-binding protein G(I)/G(S)/G(O) subunit gamma-8 isoform X1 [Camelus ferus]
MSLSLSATVCLFRPLLVPRSLSLQIAVCVPISLSASLSLSLSLPPRVSDFCVPFHLPCLSLVCIPAAGAPCPPGFHLLLRLWSRLGGRLGGARAPPCGRQGTVRREQRAECVRSYCRHCGCPWVTLGDGVTPRLTIDLNSLFSLEPPLIGLGRGPLLPHALSLGAAMSNNMAKIAEARKTVEQLKLEVNIDRMKVSQAAAELLAFCETHAKDDPLMTPVPAAENPFRDKRLFCVLL